MRLVQVGHCHLLSEAAMEIMTRSLRRQCLFVSVVLDFPLQLLLGLHFQLQDMCVSVKQAVLKNWYTTADSVCSRGVVPAGCFSSLGSLSVKHIVLFRNIFLIKCLLEL